MKTVFVDVDTQIDFLYPAGALYVPGAEGRIPAFFALARHAAARGIPVISTMDAHRENDAEFGAFPAHCVAGTLGQRKLEAQLLERRVTVPADPFEVDARGAAQVLVEKRALDCFTNPNLASVLKQLGAERYVVYGVVTEYCVRYAALGLLKTGARVEVVADAVQSLSERASGQTCEELAAAGANFTITAEILR